MSDWDPRIYQERTGFISDLGAPVVDLLAPLAGERVLDVGCGDGMLSARLVEIGCDVVGIDASPEMVSAAKARGIDAHVLDAAELAANRAYEGRFDAVFSNAALHWMHPLESVTRGIARALKPGGRFVAELGGVGNVDRIRTAIYTALGDRGICAGDVDPWRFPAPDEYAGLLQGVDLDVETMEHFERPTDLPTGIGEWIESVGRPFLNAVAPEDRSAFLSQVEGRLAGALRRSDGTWWADYVRLRVRAYRRPAA